MTATDKAFSGSVAALYESHMVPMLFAPYAAEMAARVAAHGPKDVLEIAAGTGAVTAELLKRLPEAATITATDLNQAMLDLAARKITRVPRPVPGLRCAEPAFRRRKLRCGGLPVRRHVLSRQAHRLSRGAARAARRRRLFA